MHYFLKNIMVTEKLDKEGKRTLVASMPPGGKRKKHRIMTSNDAKMVLELVKVSVTPGLSLYLSPLNKAQRKDL